MHAAVFTDIDECASTPCLNDGTCVNDINALTCLCVLGVTGSRCETREFRRSMAIETTEWLFLL